MSKRKVVTGIYEAGPGHWVGDGFPVRNLFPSSEIRGRMNPFLLLDYAGPVEFPPTNQPRGVGEHPHRGFETITLALQGSVSHRDSAGNSGTIRPGDVQWMTAASGVVHEEMHDAEFTRTGGQFEMVQLWLNLPKQFKMSEPDYQSIRRERIPLIDLGDTSYARVIAGDLGGVHGPAHTFTPVNLFDLRLSAGAHVEISIPEEHRGGIVLLRGGITVNTESSLAGEPQIAVFAASGESIRIDAESDSVVLILSGEPILEPVVSYGPFVMNTQAEIREAMEDYRAGRMGHLAPAEAGETVSV